MYGPTLFFGALRDPIDRIVSNYFFVIRDNGIQPSMYADRVLNGFGRFYDAVIRRAGTIDVARLSSMPPLPLHGHAAPVARDPDSLLRGERPKSYRDFLGGEQVAAILAENAEDAALYDWLCREGGVFVNRAKVAIG